MTAKRYLYARIHKVLLSARVALAAAGGENYFQMRVVMVMRTSRRVFFPARVPSTGVKRQGVGARQTDGQETDWKACGVEDDVTATADEGRHYTARSAGHCEASSLRGNHLGVTRHICTSCQQVLQITSTTDTGVPSRQTDMQTRVGRSIDLQTR